MSRLWRGVGLSLQAAGFVAAVWVLGGTARTHWPALSAAPRSVHPAPLFAASVLTSGTYLGLVYAWVVALRWWGQTLSYRDALGIWFVSNLARFIPGVVWQFASLAAQCGRVGVSVVAAAGSQIFQQVALLATGVVVTVATGPSLLGAWTAVLPPAAPLAIAVGVVIAALAVIPWLLPRAGELVRRASGRELAWPTPRGAALARYVTALLIPWLAYGIAFWLFAVATIGRRAPGPVTSVAVFTASYLVGILFVAAPGGIVVREAALVTMLSPVIGGGDALFLAVASRLWLLGVEVLTALVVVLATRSRPPAAGPPISGGVARATPG